MRVELKVAIIKSGITQEQLARELRIDSGYLSKIVRGWKTPSHELQRAIAKRLGCINSADKLFKDGKK